MQGTNLNVWLIVSLFLFGIISTATGQIITVDANGSADYDNVQEAIDNAVNGDVVVVNPGIYTGPGNRDIDFLGKAITVRSTDPNDPNVVEATIIDCNGTETEPHRGFYFHNGEDANSVINGLTLTNGFSPYGSGIYCYSSSPTVTNCTFTNNTAQKGGGAV